MHFFKIIIKKDVILKPKKMCYRGVKYKSPLYVKEYPHK